MGPWRSLASVSGAVALTLGAAFPLAAQPVGMTGSVAPGARVIDVRAEDECLAGSLSGARCLPAPWLLDGGDGTPIGFHALRWLLGTVGLTGSETLVVYAGPEGASDDALAVAALAYLAGQSLVVVHDGEAGEAGTGGESRSFSREVVYMAPMRLEAMNVSDEAAPLRNRLVDFARSGGTVRFTPLK